MSTAEATYLGGIYGSMATVLLLVVFVAWILLMVAHWRMFTKAGEKGWKSLIPLYSDYTLYKLVWNTKSFWIFLASSILTIITTFFCGSYAVTSAGEVVYLGESNMIVGVISFVASMVMLFYIVMSTVNTAFAYGKGFGFALGLVVLPNIFTLILAFGSAEYRGPQG